MHGLPIDEELDYWRGRAESAESQLSTAQAERDAALRELERWRHGVQIEGDYVCPDSLVLTAIRKALEEACEIAAICADMANLHENHLDRARLIELRAKAGG